MKITASIDVIEMTQLHLYLAQKNNNTNERKLEARDLEKLAYICCDFIGDYSAIVDQLWRKSDVLKKKRRKGMPPIMLEVIIYIKQNAHVVLAYRTAR